MLSIVTIILWRRPGCSAPFWCGDAIVFVFMYVWYDEKKKKKMEVVLWFGREPWCPGVACWGQTRWSEKVFICPSSRGRTWCDVMWCDVVWCGIIGWQRRALSPARINTPDQWWVSPPPPCFRFTNTYMHETVLYCCVCTYFYGTPPLSPCSLYVCICWYTAVAPGCTVFPVFQYNTFTTRCNKCKGLSR